MNGDSVNLAYYLLTLLPWVAGAGAYLRATRRGSLDTSHGQRALALSGFGLAALATSWPLGVPAQRDFLWAMVVQRLLLLLVVPPLLLAGMTRPLAGQLTRHPWVDRLVLSLARPVLSIVVVTVLLAATVLPAIVTADAHHASVAMIADVVVLAAGFTLWLPVLGRFPGVPVLSAAGQCAYLIAQGVAPTFLSIVWIFAGHPLYPNLGASSQHLMDPLLDQRIAGFLAKFVTLAVLFVVAFVVLVQADPEDELHRSTLRDDDLARLLERSQRRHG